MVSAPNGGTMNGRTAARSFCWIVSLDSLSMGPGPQVTSSALTAAQAWPKCLGHHGDTGRIGHDGATAGIATTPITPGIARTVSALLIDPTVPRNRRRPTHHRRLRAGHVLVERELLLAGHDGPCIQAAGALADHRVLRRGLGRNAAGADICAAATLSEA